MARARKARNHWNSKIDEALTTFFQTQAAIQQNQAALQQKITSLVQTQARMAETDRHNADIFAQIERRFTRIEAILVELTRMIEALPEAVREKIGFKAPS